MEDTQAILGEVRRLRQDYDEISLRLRVDTFWVKARDHLDYGLSVVRRIPMLARVCLFVGVCLASFGALSRNLKAVFLGVDILFLSLLFVGTAA